MIPKVELHLHIEGAAPPAFIRGLAQEKGVNLDGVFSEDGSYRFEGFTQFLRVYEAACTVLTGPEEFARLTTAVLERSMEQGVIYTEAFLSPDFCGGGDVGAWREYMHAMREAASRQPDIEMRGIVTCIRHFGPEQAKTAALCAAETAGDFITGFGMGGDETQGTQGDFAYSFDMAREAGLRLTTHAGEWGGAESVWQAVRDLGVERVGHGVQAIDDPALVDHLAERGIVLEVCPGSNVALGVYPDWRSHPIEKLRERGVKVTVSTDDPPFFHTTLGAEYDLLGHHFGWEDEIIREVNITAANAAFCDDATRETLLKKLEPAS
ncbi:adenosine deaminase [Litoreibacter arenae]|uniref:Adenosine deaminase n=1 Tax=Litoreibacter arenae DSM 19593 TaxID=1123360 RepID=S9QHX5_9RHOB|nr:adenosine deaminase [Litoreibacter arenae]EPX81051.1 Adenosine deaminase [Litoreibacter arenae DSM 19593]